MKSFNCDNDILQALNAGNKDAFECVYTMLFRPLCYFAERFTGETALSEDLVADCFVSILQKQPHFLSMTALKSYLYTAVRNRCFDHLRTMDRHRVYQGELRLNTLISENQIENDIIRSEVLNAVYAAIENLPEKYRNIIRLALVEGKSNDEIVQETGMAYQTVRNHKSAGIRLLKQAFKNGAGSETFLMTCIAIIDVIAASQENCCIF